MLASLRQVPAQAALLGLVLAGALAAQPTTVTLKNGSVFQGRVVAESPDALDLALPTGRIRLERQWIERISGPGTLGPDAGMSSNEALPPARSPRTPSEDATALLPALVLARPLQPVASEPEIPRRKAEDTALEFCRALQARRGREAVSELIDPEELLANSLPAQSRGLTAYARKLLARHLARVLMTATELPETGLIYSSCKVSAEPLVSAAGYDRVRVQLHGADGTTTTGVIGVLRGRVVELREGPPPFPALLATVAGHPTSTTDLARSLTDTLAGLAGSSAVRPRSLADQAASERTWVLSPRSGEFQLRLSWDWGPLVEAGRTSFADPAVKLENGRAVGVVVGEDLTLPPAAFREAFLESARSLVDAIEIEDSAMIEVADLQAWRGRVRISTQGQSFRGLMTIFCRSGRTYQVWTWSRPEDFAALLPVLGRLTDGFHWSPRAP